MKRILFIVVVMMSVIIGCANQDSDAQQDAEKEIIGTWTVFEMTHIANQDSGKMTEDTLQKYGLFEDYFFLEDHKFKQTGNLAGDGAVSTQEGNWKITGNMMIMTLQMGTQKMDVDYTWKLQEQILFLTRTFPDIKVELALRKKQ